MRDKVDSEAAKYSGHSGRVGFYVAASEAGAPPQHIAAIARHKTLNMARRYTAKADMLKKNAPHPIAGCWGMIGFPELTKTPDDFAFTVLGETFTHIEELQFAKQIINELLVDGLPALPDGIRAELKAMGLDFGFDGGVTQKRVNALLQRYIDATS